MQEANSLLMKKRYLEWFLETFSLKEPEAANLLRHIADDDDILEKVHFVDDIRGLPSAILVSAVHTGTVSFLYRLNDQYYENIHQVIHILNGTNLPEDIFIRLSFDKETFCLLCEKQVMQAPGVAEKLFYYRVIRELEQELNDRFKNREEQKNLIMKEIDVALATGDREGFYKLSAMYNQLDQ